MLIGVAVVVMAVTMVILVAFLIPVCIEIRKTATAMREFIAGTESDLKPVLYELRKTLHELKSITEGAATKTEDVKQFMEALGDTGRNLRTINNVVGAMAGVLASSSAWITGARVAGSFLLERLSKKRRRE
jgi:uncharacterized protein YoxC